MMLLLTLGLFVHAQGSERSSTLEMERALSRIESRAQIVRNALQGNYSGESQNTCQGRLTLESGVPVSTTDQSAKSTLYFTPYNGSRISLFDGSKWVLRSFSETSLVLSGLTSVKNYDVFMYDNAGTPTLELLAWAAGNTTRATALTTQNGVKVLTGSTTRRYVGTINTTSTTTTEDSVSKRNVFNYYNRVKRYLVATETADSWTYSTASWHSANNSTSNRSTFTYGETENLPIIKGLLIADTASTTPVATGSGLALTTTTTNYIKSSIPGYVDDLQRIQLWGSAYHSAGTEGYMWYQLMEYGETISGVTLYGDDGGDDRVRSGVITYVEN